MTIALVDVGTTANDGTGDPLRTAFQTVNTALTRLDDTVDVQTGYVLLKDDSGSTGVAVTTAGNVGIGTTSPAAPFDVYGANVTKAATITAITSGYSDFTPFLNTAYSSLLVKGNNNGYAGITIANPNTGAQASALAFADTVSGDAGLISYTHSDDSMTFSSGGVARFAINSLGDFTWRNAGATVGMTWDASANSNAGGLGIGTATPTNNLQIHGSSTTSVVSLTNTTTGSGGGNGTDIYTSGNTFNIYNWELDNINFYTGGALGLSVMYHATHTTLVKIPNLPTSATGLAAGTLWNNSGVLSVA